MIDGIAILRRNWVEPGKSSVKSLGVELWIVGLWYSINIAPIVGGTGRFWYRKVGLGIHWYRISMG